MTLIALIFWICLILLCLAAVGLYARAQAAPAWYYPSAFILIVICIAILGFHVFGGALR